MHLLYSLRMGGMELGVVKVANDLDPARVATTIVSCRRAEVPGALCRDHVKVIELNRRDGNDPKLVGALYSLLRRERPDVLHTHAWGTLCEGVVAARLAGVPYIVHGEHGTMELRPRNLWVQRNVWRFVDRVLAVSSTLADRMSRETGFPRDRITVIRNGVDLSRFGGRDRAQARARLGWAPQEFVVGTVGRLVPVKDQQMLIRAAARARAQEVPVTIAIVGDGPLRGALRAEAAALGIADRVHLLGERDDVPELMAALDVFALTSRSEGLSNTILEAMASGLPVVATAVGGNGELVFDGRTGILVPPEQPEKTAAALLRLFHDPGVRMAMGHAGRSRVETEFSLPGMVQNYADLYTSLAGRTSLAAHP